VQLNVHAGVGSTSVPVQRLFLLGGQGTLPGYEYRGFAGARFGLAQALITRDVYAPWVRLRLFGAAGWTASGKSTLPAAWSVSVTDGVKTSAGIGAGLLWDIIRLDLARGLNNGGRTRLYLSVTPDLADIL
jgi:outer membrane translocation and assembly module TamA